MTNAIIVKAFDPTANLKRSIRRHFTKLGFTKGHDGMLVLPGTGKDSVRKVHSLQRNERLVTGETFISRVMPKVLPFFADGARIDPKKIKLRLIRVFSKT